MGLLLTRRTGLVGSFLLLVGCLGPDPRPPPPPRADDVIAGPVDPSGEGWELVLALRDRADFVAPGIGATPDLDDMLASDRDLLEPLTWAVGGLYAHGANIELLRDPSAPWSVLQEAVANPQRSVMLALGDYGTGYPAGVGLDDGETYSVWYEGEIFLERGEHRLSLDTSGIAFLEVDIRDNTWRAQSGGGTRIPAVIPIELDGWYPIRIAMSHGTGRSWFVAFHDPPGTAPAVELAPIRLRASTQGLPGLLRYGADQPGLADVRGTSLFAGEVLDEKYDGVGPPDVGVTGLTFSQRLAGQVWIDRPGDYVLRIESDGGTRAFVDGAPVGSSTFLGPVSSEEESVKLARGWHELAIDHQARQQPAALLIGLDDGGVVDPMRPAELRPVITGRDRLVWGRDGATRPLPATAAVTLDATLRAMLQDVSISYDLEHPRWNEVVITLVTPWGTEYVVRDHVANDGTPRQIATALVTAADLPPQAPVRPVSGTWSLRVQDASGEGILHGFTITARYAGGPSAIAPIARYIASERDLGEPRRISAVTAYGSIPDGTFAWLWVRGCDEAPCTSGWSLVTDHMAPLPAARYVQVAADLASNGVATGFIDDITVWALNGERER